MMDTDILQWACTAAALATTILMMRKVWWAPIFGLLHEGLWAIVFVRMGAGPLLVAALLYSIIFAISIPKWYRERKHG